MRTSTKVGQPHGLGQRALLRGTAPVYSTPYNPDQAKAYLIEGSPESPSGMHPLSLPLLSVLSFLVATGMGYVWRSRKRHSAPVETLSMAASVAVTLIPQLVEPVKAKHLWTMRKFTILDLRCPAEYGQPGKELRQGRHREVENIMMFDARISRDPATGKMIARQQANPQWLDEVKAALPKDARILVMCSDGGSRTTQAINLLAAEGYTAVVGVQGGFNKWDQLMDRWLMMRSRAAQRKREEMLVDPVQWEEWAPAVGKRSPPSVLSSSGAPPKPASTPQYSSVPSSAPPRRVDPVTPPPPSYQSYSPPPQSTSPPQPSYSPPPQPSYSPPPQPSYPPPQPSYTPPPQPSYIPPPQPSYSPPPQPSYPPPPPPSYSPPPQTSYSPPSQSSWSTPSSAPGSYGAPPLNAFNDPKFQEQTLAAFPAKTNATVEEARVLFAQGGYNILDIRSEMEGREGRIRSSNKGSIDMPMFHAKSSYDSMVGKKVVIQEPNSRWLDDVKARFPDKDAKLIVMCSDGTSRSSQAMDLLAAEGYRNLVLLRGGYNRWDQVFDGKGAVRSPAQQASKAEWLDDPIRWGQWTKLAGSPAPPHRPVSPTAAPATRTFRELPPVGEFDDPTFQAATKAAFPAKAHATVEEARVLWKLDGYSMLDIRSEMEGREGRIRGPNKGSIDIPMFNAKAAYDSIQGKKVVTVEPNRNWLEDVKARFPSKASKIVVVCSDGTKRSTQAMDLLAAEGYRNVVMMRGGYNRWDQVFDKKLAVRNPTQQAAKSEWLDDPVEWGSWTNAVGRQPPAQRSFAPTAAPPTRTMRPVTAVGEYLDPGFQSATIAAFPAKANATVEEARVLWKMDGYSLLDIRSEMEGSNGRIRGPNKGSIDIPLINAKSTYDSMQGKKLVTQQPNPNWLEQVKSRFPNKDAKIIVVCSDGTTRSSQALDLLAGEGYRNLVLMRGGYNRWDQVFDGQLGLRSPAQQAAKAEWLDDPIEWVTWSTKVGMAAPASRPLSSFSAPATRTERPVQAGDLTFLDERFQSATIAAFPAKRTSTVEETYVLWKQGDYSLLDIRSAMEGQDGRIRGPNKGSIEIPLFNAKSSYDTVARRRVVTQEPNRQWLEQVRSRFPNKDSKIVIVCSDSRIRSPQAARLLSQDGYRNLVVLEGGYNAWDRMFDKSLSVRSPQAQLAKEATLMDPTQWGNW